jgi:hypothetical protein
MIDNVESNRQLYKKAYLIEFYKDNTTEPEEIFTFSIPPESEELTYPQRKTETKIFGGLHVDDYGVYEVKVVLSGSTINQSLKRIYKGGFLSDDYLSGEDEIYYFRDLILKYKELNFLKNNPNAKIIIYDLSKYTGLRTSAVDNCWQAFNGDFKIRRANDKPFTYKYTLEFTGVPPTDEGKMPGLPGSGALEALNSILKAIKTVLNFMNRVQGLVDDVMGYAQMVSDLLKVAGSVMTYAANLLPNLMDSVGNAATGLINATSSVVDGRNSIISMPRTVQLQALTIGLDLQNATGRLVKSTALLVRNCRDMFASEYWEIPQEVLDQYGTNNEEFKDSVNIMLNRLENSANELAAYAKSSEIPDITIGSPDPETGETGLVLSYGHTMVTLKETDSLESLAVEYMGSPDNAQDIATFNGVASLRDLVPGDVIRIPITTRTVKMTNNLIFARRGDRDNYGRDIMLTDDGFIVASNTGDYQLSKGVKNITQAVLLRLRESNAKRIRIVAYGIRTNISDPTAGIAYIISSIRLTVKNDPRVASVDKIKFKAAGDFLDVNVFYHDINNADGNAEGRV